MLDAGYSMLVEEQGPRKIGTQNRESSIENRASSIEMFTVSVETHFQASHQLALPPAEGRRSQRAGKGRCCLSRLGRAKTGRPASKAPRSAEAEPEHYHNWSVTADVSSNRLNSRGIVMDFHKLKAAVDNIVAELDNSALHKTDYFQQNSPSAENIAKYIYEKLEPKLPKGVKLQSIRVVEGPVRRRPVGSRPPVAACSAKFAPAARLGDPAPP